MISGHIKMKNEINETGKEVIDLQIKSLKKLKGSIDKSFNNAVKAISKCKSKVIICGVGKSGIIASKISATLSSVGTPSFSILARIIEFKNSYIENIKNSEKQVNEF